MSEDRLGPWLHRGVLAAGLLVIGVVATLAVVHRSDAYKINHVSGAWIALSMHHEGGVLYPPLYDGERFGGTRFMPIPIALNTHAARAVGGYVRGGKLVSGASMALLLLTLLLALRLRLRCPWSVAVGACGVVLATYPGLLAATSNRGDTLPVALQLLALLLVARTPRRPALVLAAVLCAAAVMAKLSAVWAPLAIGTWLLVHDRRGLLVYLVTFGVVLGASVEIIDRATQGHFLQNILGLGMSDYHGLESARRSLLRTPDLLMRTSTAAWLLLPAAAIGFARAASDRGIEITDVALLWAGAVLFAVLGDRGAAVNHLLDVTVLLALGAAAAWPRLPGDEATITPARSVLAAFMLWALLCGAGRHLWHDASGTAVNLAAGKRDPLHALVPLSKVIAPGERLLTEDPYISVAHGQLPVILDSWILLRLEFGHPEWTSELVDRISRQEFDKVVLMRPLESSPIWFREHHLGETIASTIAACYAPMPDAPPGYHVYVRRKR